MRGLSKRFFVFTVGSLCRDRRSIALAILVFLLCGSFIWGILPLAPGMSFEYHLLGALTGAICTFPLRRYDPLPIRRPLWMGA
jgi:membrane associated rhomboid family serine protease